jgi:hypothetical protein
LGWEHRSPKLQLRCCGWRSSQFAEVCSDAGASEHVWTAMVWIPGV